MKKSGIATRLACALIAVVCTTTLLFAPAASHAACHAATTQAASWI